jgi:hypothetical protein
MALRAEYKYFNVNGFPVREERRYDASGKLLIELTSSMSRDSRRIAISKTQYDQLLEAKNKEAKQLQE